MTRPIRAVGAALAPLLALLALAGCGEDEPDGADRLPTATAEGTRKETDAPPVERASCPAGIAGCRTTSGVVIYVERVDPDGDGDAHFVLASDEDITARGVSVVDVRRDLRPDPLPGPGDRVSAAGPVYRGSYGQRQIEAVVVHATYTPSR